MSQWYPQCLAALGSIYFALLHKCYFDLDKTSELVCSISGLRLDEDPLQKQ
jgi:hypothetical protein